MLYYYIGAYEKIIEMEITMKSFSDYEEMYITQNRSRTLGELLDSCSDPDTYPKKDTTSHLGLHYTIISHSVVDSIRFKLKKDFFTFAAKQKGFLDLPILGVIYDEDVDGFRFAVQRLFDNTYRVIYYDYAYRCFETSSYGVSDVYNELRPSAFKTIGDLYDDVKENLVY